MGENFIPSCGTNETADQVPAVKVMMEGKVERKKELGVGRRNHWLGTLNQNFNSDGRQLMNQQ